MATIMPVGEQANRVFLVVVTILIATLLVNPGYCFPLSWHYHMYGYSAFLFLFLLSSEKF